MEELAAEMRGRQAAVETLVMTTIAAIAAHTSDPVGFASQIMAETEESLRKAQQSAATDDAQAAAYAVAAFEHFSAAMLAHVTKIAGPAGRA